MKSRKQGRGTPSEPPPQPPIPIPGFELKPGEDTEDERLLSRKEAPVSTASTTDAWRVFRIMGEFVEGFDTLARLGPAVTIFGSARTVPDDPHYAAARETAHDVLRRLELESAGLQHFAEIVQFCRPSLGVLLNFGDCLRRKIS